MKPRKLFCYGMEVGVSKYKSDTWVEGEMACSDYGQFRRRAVAKHEKTGKLVNCRADVPDTWFSIPATTKTEIGFLTFNDASELIFHPYPNQDETPAQYRKSVKRAYK
jgi:hypothetical protein